ncbi:MAG: hypothetical protein QXX51_04045 [Candidatus Bathyarchaeia archaeon]
MLFILYEGAARCCELSERTGKPSQYVRRYLANMRKYGLAEQNGAFWFLTDSGVSFTEHLKRHYENILNNTFIEYRKKEERKEKDKRKLTEKRKAFQAELKQISASFWLSESELSVTEKEVVELLVNHYNQSGSKFILVKDEFELSEKLKANSGDVLEALKNLRQNNIIYLIRSEFKGYWKVGLKKNFFIMLQNSSAEQGPCI